VLFRSPILGDRTYGEADSSMPRQALHAWRLTLPHPVTRQLLRVEASLPSDLGITDTFYECNGPAR